MELFRLDASDVSAADIALIRACFPERFSRAERFARSEDGLALIAAGVLLHRVLGVEDERIVLKTAEGRPFIEGGPEFSLSHSRGRCVLAIGEGRLGVDIEKLDEGNLIAAHAALTDEELGWVSPAPLERFHLLWTRKESIFKALGGFADPKEIPALEGRLPEGLFVCSRLWQGFALSICCDRAFVMPEPKNIRRI